MKYILIVVSILCLIFLFSTIILSFAVKDLWNQNQAGKIYYDDIKKEIKVNREIENKYKKLKEYNLNNEKEKKKFINLLNDNQNYIFGEKENETLKSNKSGKKNFPIIMDEKLPDIIFDESPDIIDIQLQYRKYIELLQNKIIHNANYVLIE